MKRDLFDSDDTNPIEEFLEKMIRNVFWAGLGGAVGFGASKVATELNAFGIKDSFNKQKDIFIKELQFTDDKFEEFRELLKKGVLEISEGINEISQT